ncbi:MAG: hypothetical protein EOM53_01255 [Alphaproteobacteria bacterium]|nr:hypothetical protein [Alphaproteobacteria bacterium]
MAEKLYLPTEELLEKCIALYTLFYENRHILKQAPKLHLSLEDVAKISSVEQYHLFRTDLRKVSLFLLGLPFHKPVQVSQMVQALQIHYKSGDFLYNFLLDYIKIEYEENQILLNETFMENKENQERWQKNISFKIKEKGFPVDADLLIKNYLTFASKNPSFARKILFSNPCYFAPLKTADEKGNILIKPKDTLKRNKALASFLKDLLLSSSKNT